MDLDLAICEAGERKEDRIRTAIVYPGWVYGPGIGEPRQIQRWNGDRVGMLKVLNERRLA